MPSLQQLIERDGTACVWCGRELWSCDLTLEHLLPRSRRGHATAENLAIACRRCNRARGTEAVSTYVRRLLDAGQTPRLLTLCAALERLGRSERRVHAEYGRRQLELIARSAPDQPARCHAAQAAASGEPHPHARQARGRLGRGSPPGLRTSVPSSPPAAT